MRSILTSWLVVITLFLISMPMANAQESGSFYEGEPIHAIYYDFKNLPANKQESNNFQIKVRKEFKVYPHMTMRILMLDAYLGKVKLLPEVGAASYEIRPAATGGIDLFISVEFSDKPADARSKSGVFTGEKRDFPQLYLDNKSLLTMRISASEMIYSNHNTWYGRPELMTNGNPLATHPSGKGMQGWVEGWISAGIYGITPISTKHNIYTYAGASYIISGSAGNEIFTNRARVFGGVEDAYIGIVGAKTTKVGNNILYNLSFGRQQFSIGSGFIIRNTASNGDNRAALQLNPRWAADYLALGTVKYNNLILQIFQLKPDELPIIDSKTIIRGANFEWGGNYARLLGLTYLNIPKSEGKYYTPTGGVLQREGLSVFNARLYGNNAPGTAGIFYKAEFAYQTNCNHKMRAYAGFGEIGWSFANVPTSPVLSYRYAHFSGDDPDTEAYERWDPLLSGGNGEEWVLGANHFKIVQNSNMNAHRLQLNFRPTRKTELVPQILYFYADEKNNISGNPALSYMPHREYGYEVNLTAKYFHSRRWYVHGHIAYTIPGYGVRKALGDTSPWLSLMAFVRYSL